MGHEEPFAAERPSVRNGSRAVCWENARASLRACALASASSTVQSPTGLPLTSNMSS